jgi:hypothetical protein
VKATTNSHNTILIHQLTDIMKPWTLFLFFAWLAITALAMNILSDFWLPMLIGAVIIALLVRVALPKR